MVPGGAVGGQGLNDDEEEAGWSSAETLEVTETYSSGRCVAWWPGGGVVAKAREKEERRENGDDEGAEFGKCFGWAEGVGVLHVCVQTLMKLFTSVLDLWKKVRSDRVMNQYRTTLYDDFHGPNKAVRSEGPPWISSADPALFFGIG